MKCAGVVAECAAECADGITSQSCISCVGDSYDTCKDCFLLAQVIKQQGILNKAIVSLYSIMYVNNYMHVYINNNNKYYYSWKIA